MSASLKLFALAGAVAVVAAAQPAQAQTHHAHASPRMAPLAGSAQRSLAGSAVVGHASPAASVHVSIFLKPSHQKLLAQLAAQSSARPGLSARMMNLLFRPSPTARAQVSAYMRSQGFTPAGQGVLVSSFAGNAAQAEQAFGVSLAQYRGADGKAFRAPTSALHLPAAIAGDVLSVDGLSTQALMHPAGLHVKHTHLQPNALTGCTRIEQRRRGRAVRAAGAGSGGRLQLADAARHRQRRLRPVDRPGRVLGDELGRSGRLQVVLRHHRSEHAGERQRRYG